MSEHDWNMKPTAASENWFSDPSFCATALRRMVANCVAMHPSGRSLYTDGERKLLAASAQHIEDFIKRTAS